MEPEEMLRQGYTHSCIGCGVAYKGIPTVDHKEEGQEVRKIPQCPRCKGASFADIKEVLEKGF